MAEPSDTAPTAAEATPRASEALYGLRPALVRAVVEAAEANDRERVRRLVEPLHYSDLADLLERLSSEHRKRVVVFIGPHPDADMMAELDDAVREEVMDLLSPKQIADVVSELETDDAVAVIEDLDKETQKEVLAQVEPEDRADIEQNLAFPEDSAGRMMQRDPVSIPEMWTVGETIDHMRETPDLPDDFYDIFVIDAQTRLKGTLPLNVLLRTKRPVRVAQIMKRDLVTIPATMDREELARLFRDRDLVSAPVVDSIGRLVGMITVDDVVDVIQEEAEEDMLRLQRVSDTGIHEPFHVIARGRVQWLVVTLINTILAALVISQFQKTIESLVALAVLMPIVAAMGGNAGMQVVTVTVPRAGDEGTPARHRHARRAEGGPGRGRQRHHLRADHGHDRRPVVRRLAALARARRRDAVQHDVERHRRHDDPADARPARHRPRDRGRAVPDDDDGCARLFPVPRPGDGVPALTPFRPGARGRG